jgi:hypothetical protein
MGGWVDGCKGVCVFWWKMKSEGGNRKRKRRRKRERKERKGRERK